MRTCLLVLLLVAVTVGVSAAVDRESGLVTWFRLRRELRAAGERIDHLGGEVEALRAQVAALREDPFALERAIREDLELARPGEVVVRFSPRSSPAGPAGSHEESPEHRQPSRSGARK